MTKHSTDVKMVHYRNVVELNHRNVNEGANVMR